MNCNVCKCNECGYVNECEIIMERIEYLDKIHKECTPVIECTNFSTYKNRVRFNKWECPIKNEH